MSSAVYRYAPSLTDKSRQELFEFLKRGQGETIFYKEGITATVAVQRQNGGRVLKVNGKPEASTDRRYAHADFDWRASVACSRSHRRRFVDRTWQRSHPWID